MTAVAQAEDLVQRVLAEMDKPHVDEHGWAVPSKSFDRDRAALADALEGIRDHAPTETHECMYCHREWPCRDTVRYSRVLSRIAGAWMVDP